MYALELIAGEHYTCQLAGKTGGGYTWERVVEGAANVVNITMQTTSNRLSVPQGSDLSSVWNMNYRFTVTGVAPGHVTVRFQLRRPWETDEPPLEERVLDVTVRRRKAQ